MKQQHDDSAGIYLPRGIEIDLDQGWAKLVSRQFGGSPGRAFAELIQNLLDSYPDHIPPQQRRGDITTGARRVAITDHGEGMSRRRLELMLTLGGTNKDGDPAKVGQFGIGFYSIFNEKLGTQRVTVTTTCEGQGVELAFMIERPGRRPRIRSTVLPRPPTFSTRIEVQFGDDASVRRCVEAARHSLRFYPCQVTIDDRPVTSVWTSAREAGLDVQEEGPCSGFVRVRSGVPMVTLMSKYEYVTRVPIPVLATGGRSMTHDLRDHRKHGVPLVPGADASVNCDDLRLTISRDNCHMDRAFRRMRAFLAGLLCHSLLPLIQQSADSEPLRQLVVANQYILARPLRALLQDTRVGLHGSTAALVRARADARVYRIVGRRRRVSLQDLKAMRTPGLPLFHAAQQRNLRWLGGNFEHDFVVVPPACSLGGGAPALREELLEEVLGDAVDLDAVADDPAAVARLVERGVVDRAALEPAVALVDELAVDDERRAFMGEITELLGWDAVLAAVRRNLMIPCRQIEVCYFEVTEGTATVPVALLDDTGAVMDGTARPRSPVKLVIGLMANHPLIEQLARCDNQHRALYALTYLARELARCQRALTPHTPFFEVVQSTLARDLRAALITDLVEPPEQREPPLTLRPAC